MAEQADRPIDEGTTTTPKKDKGARKSWAEEHGGLVFLSIVFLVIASVVLYEACMS